MLMVIYFYSAGHSRLAGKLGENYVSQAGERIARIGCKNNVQTGVSCGVGTPLKYGKGIGCLVNMHPVVFLVNVCHGLAAGFKQSPQKSIFFAAKIKTPERTHTDD